MPKKSAAPARIGAIDEEYLRDFHAALVILARSAGYLRDHLGEDLAPLSKHEHEADVVPLVRDDA